MDADELHDEGPECLTLGQVRRIYESHGAGCWCGVCSMVEELQESFETQEEAMVGVTLTADATQRVVEALDRAR